MATFNAMTPKYDNCLDCESAVIEENVDLKERIAEISTDWIVAQEQIKVLREALEWIMATNQSYDRAEDDYYKCLDIAREALQRAGE